MSEVQTVPLLGTWRQIDYAEHIRQQWREAFPQVQFPDIRWAKFWLDTKDATPGRPGAEVARRSGLPTGRDTRPAGPTYPDGADEGAGRESGE